MKIVVVLPRPGSIRIINHLVAPNCSVRVITGKLNRHFKLGGGWLLGVVGESLADALISKSDELEGKRLQHELRYVSRLKKLFALAA